MIKEQVIIKKDTSQNWEKAKNFIPKDGEIIIYTDVGTKIGDGKTKIGDLPFIHQNFYFMDGTTLVIKSKKIERSE